MERMGNIKDTSFLLAEPAPLPQRTFIGRETEVQLCRVAWGISSDGTTLMDSETPPLHFRLQSAPGLGKNEIVYELARKLGKPLYIIQGHEELTPEDPSLLLVPDPYSNSELHSPPSASQSTCYMRYYPGKKDNH